MCLESYNQKIDLSGVAFDASVTWAILSWSYLVRLGLVVVAYFVVAKVGLALSAVYGSVSLLWPPTGVALAIVLLLGWQYWPGILLGAFLANDLTNGLVSFAI